jgi:hypothetical protein
VNVTRCEQNSLDDKNRIRLWHLWEIMKKFQSRLFYHLISVWQELKNECDACRRQEAGVLSASRPLGLEGHIERTTAWLAQTAKFCKELDIPIAAQFMEMKKEYIEGSLDQVDYSSLCADLWSAETTLMQHFWDRVFIEIPEAQTRYVNNYDLLGEKVSKAFPSAKEEFYHAGNCLATDNGTGTVFHLMRAVERALRALCVHLRILRIIKRRKSGKKKFVPIEYAQWDKHMEAIQEKVDKKIGRMAAGEKKQIEQEFYYPLLGDLKGFKDAFRNHVMHTRATYTTVKAEEVLYHVKRFMVRLSERVSEVPE